MERTIADRRFGLFTASVWEDRANDVICDCHIRYTDGGKNWEASLAVAEDHKELTNWHGDEPVPVPQQTLDRIRTWAESHGY